MLGDSQLTPASLLNDANLDFLNTLAVAAKARCMAEIYSVDELQRTLAWWKQQTRSMDVAPPLMVLGEGSNIVLASDIPGLVLRMHIGGRDEIAEDDEHVWLKVGAGENWADLVAHCVNFHLWGIENLAMIPGTVGAAPIQNIGAYGVELKDVFEELSAVEISSGVSVTFDREACQFGYRDSIFKRRLSGRYIITSVTLKLKKQSPLNYRYPALQHYFEVQGQSPVGGDEIFAAVSRIRKDKLPDPASLPNVGSFFQNPIVDSVTWEKLRDRFPGIVGYPVLSDDESAPQVKLAAGWMIEHAGWKGYSDGVVGVHEQQALVLINPGHGTGKQVLALAEKIQKDIDQRFGVALCIEPIVVNYD